MDYNYFFIDGSTLLSDIKKYITKHPSLKGKKFDPVIFSKLFSLSNDLTPFHGRSYRRIVFYFVTNDKRVKEFIKVPDFKKSGAIEDLEIKYCGKKIPTYKKAADWLDGQKAPNYVRDSLYKSEKAVDTKICCDALILLSLNKLDRIFLYTNDYDFIPLCQTIKSMGANINLIQLTDSRVNKDLVREFDAFHSFKDEKIYECFGTKFKH